MELAKQIEEASALVAKRFSREGLRVWDLYDVGVESKEIKVYLENDVVTEISLEPFKYLCHALDPDDVLQVLNSILAIPEE